MLKRLAGPATAAFLLVACAETPTQPIPVEPAFAAVGSGPWVARVTGGGTNERGNVIEWISLNVRKNAEGEVSGNIEYANEGIQNWRYHLAPECLAVSPDGSKAVAIGARTLSQGPDAPPEGTRVAFLIQDNGNGLNLDKASTFFAGTFSCEFFLPFVASVTAVTSGNYSISTR